MIPPELLASLSCKLSKQALSMSFDKPSDTVREGKTDLQVQNPYLVQLLVSLVKDPSP